MTIPRKPTNALLIYRISHLSYVAITTLMWVPYSSRSYVFVSIEVVNLFGVHYDYSSSFVGDSERAETEKPPAKTACFMHCTKNCRDDEWSHTLGIGEALGQSPSSSFRPLSRLSHGHREMYRHTLSSSLSAPSTLHRPSFTLNFGGENPSTTTFFYNGLRGRNEESPTIRQSLTFRQSSPAQNSCLPTDHRRQRSAAGPVACVRPMT